MSTVVILGGPKAVGKTWTGELLQAALGVRYIDGDDTIQALIDQGVTPDPEDGWLVWMQQAVIDAASMHAWVSVEVTGEWESEYKLMRNLQNAGIRVLCVWLTAPEDETIARLKSRTRRRLPVTEDEARVTYRKGHQRAIRERWDLTLDMSSSQRPGHVIEAVRALL